MKKKQKQPNHLTLLFWNLRYIIPEKNMQETVQAALQQIADKKYEQTLMNQGIEPQRIRKYGFAFRGKEILIGYGDFNMVDYDAVCFRKNPECILLDQNTIKEIIQWQIYV